MSAASIIAQWRLAPLSYDCGVRVRCAPVTSVPIEPRQGSGGAAPGKFLVNFTPVFKMLKIVIYSTSYSFIGYQVPIFLF